ncbi:MAG: lysophospholipid acyltransferase family protein [Steroidobacteraceae bacterium]
MQWIASVVYTTLLFAWVLLFAMFFNIASLVVPLSARYRLARIWAHVILGGVRVFCGLDYRITGREHLPAGGHVALWKHSSSWETFAMVIVCPAQVWVLKRELLWIPFVGWGIRQMHAIAIDRGSGPSAVRQVVEKGRRYIERGIWVMVFPEGTRMAAGETRKYGTSGALLAREAGCLVVPIAHDAGYYWPRRGLLKRRGTVDVVIGRPIDPTGRDPRDVNDEAQRWIEATIADLRRGKQEDHVP